MSDLESIEGEVAATADPSRIETHWQGRSATPVENSAADSAGIHGATETHVPNWRSWPIAQAHPEKHSTLVWHGAVPQKAHSDWAAVISIPIVAASRIAINRRRITVSPGFARQPRWPTSLLLRAW